MIEMNSITISRQEERPFDYASIRQDAIELVQKLSGKIWTDFNIHDPGVTILEQIVFTLTELGYKTGFNIEDYLADSDGNIDYDSQAMYRPSLASQSFPVTVDEYSAFFKERVYCERPHTRLRCYPEKVQFSVDENGFYRVVIFMPGMASNWVSESVFAMFWRRWRKWRCMGDHVCDVRIKWLGGEARFDEYTAVPQEDEMPTGMQRNVTDFLPIIELFPTIYREGESAEPLKKFLAPVEFVFQRILGLIDSFPHLFSVRADDREISLSYNRALDQMLAMYGVQFPHFRFIDFPRLVRSKVQYLRELPELLLHRSGIFWRRRIELMLGIHHDPFDKLEIYLVDGIFANEKAGRVYVVIFAEPQIEELFADDVERFVCNEISAHLLPTIYWLPKDGFKGEFRDFAALYDEWENDGPMKITMSSRMMNWLQSHKQYISKKIWL